MKTASQKLLVDFYTVSALSVAGRALDAALLPTHQRLAALRRHDAAVAPERGLSGRAARVVVGGARDVGVMTARDG